MEEHFNVAVVSETSHESQYRAAGSVCAYVCVCVMWV